MSYRGQVYRIPCDRGGLQRNANIDLIPPEGMVHPSKNINMHQGGRGKRGGTGVVNATPTAIDSSSRIRGIGYYRQENGDTKVIVATSSPKLFQDTVSGTGNWSSDITGASWTTANKTVMFEQMDDLMFICNGVDDPQQYNGAGSTSDVTTLNGDWSGNNNPSMMLKHGRGEAEKMWAIGVADHTGRVYYSKTRDPNTWAGAGTGNVDIETSDGFGIIGIAEFGDRLICFGRRQVFIINDESITTAEWGYQKAQWEGGAGSAKLIVTTPFDIFVMAEDGDIYSVSTAQQYGDYRSASVLKDSKMHEWIKEFVDLTNIDDFHAIYDPKLRAIKWFVRRKTLAHVDTCLVYFIDRQSSEAWIVHDNQSNDSGYKASASALIRAETGNFKVYTGGWDDGFVWELETVNLNDNSSAYSAGFKTARLPFDNPRIRKRYDKVWIIAKEEGTYNLDIDWWVDGEPQTQINVDLTPSGSFVLGTSLLDTGVLGGDAFIDTDAELDQYGKRIEFEIFNNRVDEDFFVSQILIDYQPLGADLDD